MTAQDRLRVAHTNHGLRWIPTVQARGCGSRAWKGRYPRCFVLNASLQNASLGTPEDVPARREGMVYRAESTLTSRPNPACSLSPPCGPPGTFLKRPLSRQAPAHAGTRIGLLPRWAGEAEE